MVSAYVVLDVPSVCGQVRSDPDVNTGVEHIASGVVQEQQSGYHPYVVAWKGTVNTGGPGEPWE